MRQVILMPLLALAILITGCAGSQGTATPGDATVSGGTYEVSEVYLMVSPNPKEVSKILFDKIVQPYMTGISSRSFADGLGEMLKRDLGINADFTQLRRTYNYKTSQKAGFVWDKNLYAWQAAKKMKTGKQTIEIKSTVPNPVVTAVETIITVKNGGDVIREYKIQAAMNSTVRDEIYQSKAEEYFQHIPLLLKIGITGFIIGDFDIVQYYVDSVNTLELLKLKRNPPEEALKKLREMVTDIDPSTGIVMEDLYDSGSGGPEEGNKSGATLLD